MTSSDRPLRILEVAATPFPSRQGTQVMLHHLCEGLARRGHDVHLLAYAHGAFPLRSAYAIHRIPDFPRFRSLRSGPCWERPALDLVVAAWIRLLVRRLGPDVLHLHNVEAAAAALIVPPRPGVPCVYHAHNVMEAELPTYGLPKAPASALGRWLDATLAGRADGVLAVSESTREALLAAGADPSRTVTVEPGMGMDEIDSTAPAAAGPAARASRPAAGGRGPLRAVHLGNLDCYQGLDLVLDALASLRARGVDAGLTVASESAPGPVREAAAARRVPVRFAGHGPVAGALSAVADCDAAVLGRRVAGGFPMKLIALLRAGVPVAATPGAVAGLGVEDVASVAEDGSAEALGRAVERAARGEDRAARLERGRRMALERWSAEAGAARTERALRDVLARATVGRPPATCAGSSRSRFRCTPP